MKEPSLGDVPSGDTSRTTDDEEGVDPTSTTTIEETPAEDPEPEDGDSADPIEHTTTDTPPGREEEVATGTGGRASKRVPKQSKKTKRDDGRSRALTPCDAWEGQATQASPQQAPACSSTVCWGMAVRTQTPFDIYLSREAPRNYVILAFIHPEVKTYL